MELLLTCVVELAIDVCVTSSGVGTVTLKTDECDITLKNVLFVPELRGNFLSVSKITRSEHAVEFGSDYGIVRNPKNQIVLRATKRRDLYVVCGIRRESSFSLRSSICDPNSLNR